MVTWIVVFLISYRNVSEKIIRVKKHPLLHLSMGYVKLTPSCTMMDENAVKHRYFYAVCADYIGRKVYLLSPLT